MPLGGEAVARRREPEPVGQVPLEQGRVLAADAGATAGERVLAAPRRGCVDDDRHLAQAGGDGSGGVLDVHFEAGAARHRGVGEPAPHAEALAELEGPHHAVGGHQAVDVGDGQAGVVQRAADHLDLELGVGSAEAPVG